MNDSLKYEVRKLFNGIPIHEGIQEIIKKSGYKYQYTISTHLLGSHENWRTTLSDFDYLETTANKIKFELNQNSENNECYNASLRLFYDDEEIMKQDFFVLKEKFEELGEKIDTETIVTENQNIKDQTVMVYFKKGNQIPNLGFSYSTKIVDSEYQIFINYENCLKK